MGREQVCVHKTHSQGYSRMETAIKDDAGFVAWTSGLMFVKKSLGSWRYIIHQTSKLRSTFTCLSINNLSSGFGSYKHIGITWSHEKKKDTYPRWCASENTQEGLVREGVHEATPALRLCNYFRGTLNIRPQSFKRSCKQWGQRRGSPAPLFQKVGTMHKQSEIQTMAAAYLIVELVGSVINRLLRKSREVIKEMNKNGGQGDRKQAKTDVRESDVSADLLHHKKILVFPRNFSWVRASKIKLSHNENEVSSVHPPKQDSNYI